MTLPKDLHTGGHEFKEQTRQRIDRLAGSANMERLANSPVTRTMTDSVEALTGVSSLLEHFRSERSRPFKEASALACPQQGDTQAWWPVYVTEQRRLQSEWELLAGQMCALIAKLDALPVGLQQHQQQQYGSDDVCRSYSEAEVESLRQAATRQFHAMRWSFENIHSSLAQCVSSSAMSRSTADSNSLSGTHGRPHIIQELSGTNDSSDPVQSRWSKGSTVASEASCAPTSTRRAKFTTEAVQYLAGWLQDHLSDPYPSARDKQDMCLTTGLSFSQVSNWFINQRMRNLPALKEVQHTPQKQQKRREAEEKVLYDLSGGSSLRSDSERPGSEAGCAGMAFAERGAELTSLNDHCTWLSLDALPPLPKSLADDWPMTRNGPLKKLTLSPGVLRTPSKPASAAAPGDAAQPRRHTFVPSHTPNPSNMSTSGPVARTSTPLQPLQFSFS